MGKDKIDLLTEMTTKCPRNRHLILNRYAEQRMIQLIMSNFIMILIMMLDLKSMCSIQYFCMTIENIPEATENGFEVIKRLLSSELLHMTHKNIHTQIHTHTYTINQARQWYKFQVYFIQALVFKDSQCLRIHPKGVPMIDSMCMFVEIAYIW